MEKNKNWVEENLEDIECVLCWSSDSNILNHNGTHIIFHTVDRTILFLEEALINHEKNGVLVYPVTKTEVTVPMCVEALYSLMKNKTSRKKVLLISQNIAVRELYWQLKVNYLRLNEVFPLGIIKMDGTVKPQLKTSDVSRISDVQCSFLHTSNPKFMPNEDIAKEIGCIIIDATGYDKNLLKEIIEWSEKNGVLSLIILESNPYSENFDLFKSYGIPVWGWDSNSLSADFENDLEELEKNPQKYYNPFSLSVFHIRNWLKGIKREFIEVKDEEITNALNEALQLYFDIKKLCKNTKNEALSRALITYLSCKYAFERMLAPLEITENECKMTFLAKTIEKRIENLEYWQNILSTQDPYFGSFWGKTYSLIKVLYQKFISRGNPKYEQIKKIIKESINNNEKILIFNYSEPYARALKTALEKDFALSDEELQEKGIFITSINERHVEADYDKCIIFGQMPFRASWLLRTACAHKVIFLVYPSEKALLKYQFESEEKKFTDSFGRGTRINFLKRILKKEDLKRLPPPPKPGIQNVFSLKLDEKQIKDEEKLKPLLSDIEIDDELILEEEIDFEDEDELEETSINEEGKVVVKCCKIVLEDGGVMYVRPSRKIPIFKNGKRLEYVSVQKAREGDLLIVVKNNIKNSLAQEIIKKADNHPSMQKLKFLVNSWVVALRKGMAEHNDSVHKFLEKLQAEQKKENSPVITNWLTIQLWKEGLVIGPQNSKNIKFIGKIYNQQYLVDHYREIGAAISRLRGIHHRLLRKLNDMVLRAGLKSISGSIQNELIDEEFNLYVEDFADIISIEKIKSISLNESAERSKLDKIVRYEK
ncbi:MAG: hypothetical protein D6734_10875 [Candidatus Schekmanbacteria bacterium]|nr:MAG: hypothetical protein D6734_10875 [Candidatus Schekmanbacteria bacterium]